jgi:hypothetical protein
MFVRVSCRSDISIVCSAWIRQRFFWKTAVDALLSPSPLNSCIRVSMSNFLRHCPATSGSGIAQDIEIEPILASRAPVLE